MKTRKLVSLLLCLILTASVFTAFDITAFAAGDTVTLNITGTYYQTMARSALSLVNSFRTSNTWYWNSDNTTKTTVSGLNALVYDYGLEQIAMQRAAEIAINWAHERPDGQSCFTCLDSNGNGSYGENIAAGYSTAESVINGWREESQNYDGQGHRRNMLYSGFTAIGMACFEYQGTKYWVQEFSFYTNNTTSVSAVDTQKTVPVSVLKSKLQYPSISLSYTSISLEVGNSVALPVCTLSVSCSDRWPSASVVATVTPSYTVKNTDIAYVSGGKLYGKDGGNTTATANFMGALAEIAITVKGCNHVFEDTVIKAATHYERGLMHRRCTKCGYEYDAPIPRLSYFPDVNDEQWFFECVDYCAEKGFVSGYVNGKFGPADKLQRQDFVLILARIAGAELESYENASVELSDLVQGKYYYTAVAWAVDNGIIGGYTSGANKGKFGVGDPITREQVATILYRYLNSPAVDDAEAALSVFSDSYKVSAFAKDAMAWAYSNSIITGKNATTLAPTLTASRAEIAMIIMRTDKAGLFA